MKGVASNRARSVKNKRGKGRGRITGWAGGELLICSHQVTEQERAEGYAGGYARRARGKRKCFKKTKSAALNMSTQEGGTAKERRGSMREEEKNLDRREEAELTGGTTAYSFKISMPKKREGLNYARRHV